jgi:hypothetical protein
MVDEQHDWVGTKILLFPNVSFFLIFIVKTFVVETFDLLPLPISFPLVLELSKSGLE